MYTISLLGCGKLGYPLALKLLDKGHLVKGSTTSPEKYKHLRTLGIDAYLFHLDNTIPKDFFESDILVLTLPFKKSFEDPRIYKIYIDKIYTSIIKTNIQHIIFTSSSSVYPKDGQDYLPTDEFIPPNFRSEVLLSCENKLKSLVKPSVIILRLGGIYGRGKPLSNSNKMRRLISQHEVLSHIEDNLLNIGTNLCINAFKMIIR